MRAPETPSSLMTILVIVVFCLSMCPCRQIFAVDADGDDIDDQLESQIANLFSPVLHKHPNDLIPNLGDPRVLPDLRDQNQNQIIHLIRKSSYENNVGQRFPESIFQFDNFEWTVSQELHYWKNYGAQHWWRPFCPHGKEVESLPGGYYGLLPTFYIDIPGDQDHREEMRGPIDPEEKPLFYHLYKDGNYYYLQYWYYMWSNDLDSQTRKHSWHEGEWEHIAIRFTMNNNNPNTIASDLVNFYQHTWAWTVEDQDCWWSTQNNPGTPSLGFDLGAGKTHLHIWLARNAHASYNRFMDVYKLYVRPIAPVVENYIDDLAYHTQYLNGPYYDWDVLVNMGEPTSFKIENADVHPHVEWVYDPEHPELPPHPELTHFNWLYHYEENASYPEFLTFEDYFGYTYWAEQNDFLGVKSTPPPKSPVETKHGNHRVWDDFYEDAYPPDRRGGDYGKWYESQYKSWHVWPGNHEIITENTQWNGNHQMQSHVVITNGATLTITGDPNTTVHVSAADANIRKIFVENGYIIINNNIRAEFENVSLILTEHVLNDNTTNLRNVDFDCPNEEWYALSINRSLTNAITQCNFANCRRGARVYPVASNNFLNVLFTMCDFQGPQNAVNAIYLHHTGDNTSVIGCTFAGFQKPICIYDSAPRINDNLLTWNGPVYIPNDVWRLIGISILRSYAWLRHNTIEGFAMGICSVDNSCPRIEGNYITNSGFAHLFNSYSTPDLSWEASNYLADAADDRIISIKSDGYGMPLMYDGFNSISGAIVNDWVPYQIYPPHHSQRVAMRFNFFHFGRPGIQDQNDYRYNYWMSANEWQNNPRQMDPNCGWDDPNNPEYLTAGMLDLRIGERDPAQNPEYGSMRRDILIQRYGDLFSAQNSQNTYYPWPGNGWLTHENDYQQVNYPQNRQPMQIYADFNAANNLFEQRNYNGALMAYQNLSSDCQQTSRYHLQLACLQRMLWCRKLGAFIDPGEDFNDIAFAHPEPAVRALGYHLGAQLDEWEGQYASAISKYEDMINDEDSERADSIYSVIGAGFTYLSAARHVELSDLDDKLDEEYFTRLQRTSLYGSIQSLKPEYLSDFEAKSDILMADLHRPKSLEQSEYIITSSTSWIGTVVLEDDVVIDAGGSLTIEPGTIVLGNNINIVVNGTLTAVGTAGQPIRLQNKYPGSTTENYTVPGINIVLAVNSSQNSEFSNCVFDGSRKAICINVDLVNDIANCEFIKCDTAIYANSTILPSLTIRDCSFSNDGANDLLDGVSSFSVIGIDLSYLSPSVITNCVFRGPLRPIIVRNSDLQIDNCLITNTEQHEVTEEVYALELHYCTGKLIRNTIAGYPSGIMLYDSDPSLYSNKIEDCYYEGIRLINDSYPDMTYYGTGGKNWCKYNGGQATSDICQVRIDGSVYPYIMDGHNNIWDSDPNAFAIWSSLPASGVAIMNGNYWGNANPVGSDLFNHYSATNYFYQPVDIEPNQPIEGYLASADEDTNLYLESLRLIAEEEFENAIPLLREVSLYDTIMTNRIGALSLLMDCIIRTNVDRSEFLSHVTGLADSTTSAKIRRRCLNQNAKMLTEIGEYQAAIEYYESVVADEEVSYEDSVCAVIDAGNVYLRMQNEDNIVNSSVIRLGKMESLVPISAADQNEKVQYLIGLLRNRKNDLRIDQRNRFVPSEFRVYQNYPNPFNGYTTLRFDLNVNSRVMINVYDLLGRNVMTVLDKPLQSGKYFTNINMMSMSSGIYFVRVQTVERSAIIKTTLIK